MLLCCCTGTNAASRSSLFAFFPLPPLLLGRLEPAPSRPPPPLFRIPALFAMNAINLGVKIGISIATLVNTGCVSRKLVAGISRGNHIYYTSRLYFRAGMKIHSAKLNMMKEKKRERKSMTLFPYLWKGKRWGGKKKLNCESFDPLHLEYLNHCWYFLLLSFNISFFIDEELTFKTIAVYIYIYVYIRVSYNKYWTFSNSWLPPLPPSPQGNKVDEIRNFVTDRWWRHFFLTNIYYRLLFFLTNRHESLSFKRPSFSTYVLNSCSPECKIYTIEKLIISRISMGEKSW